MSGPPSKFVVVKAIITGGKGVHLWTYLLPQPLSCSTDHSITIIHCLCLPHALITHSFIHISCTLSCLYKIHKHTTCLLSPPLCTVHGQEAVSQVSGVPESIPGERRPGMRVIRVLMRVAGARHNHH